MQQGSTANPLLPKSLCPTPVPSLPGVPPATLILGFVSTISPDFQETLEANQLERRHWGIG